MIVHLTREQEQRIEAIIHSGAYQTIEDVVEAALTAVEQRAAPGFEGAEYELEALLSTTCWSAFGGDSRRRILGFGGSDDRCHDR
jgi:hypothetical protein